MLLFVALSFCLVGMGVWYFWLLLDQPKSIDNYERIETENSTGSLTSSFRKIMNGNGQNLFNQEGSTTFEKNNLDSLRRARNRT